SGDRPDAADQPNRALGCHRHRARGPDLPHVVRMVLGLGPRNLIMTKAIRSASLVFITVALFARAALVLAADAKTATLGIEGMTCGGCAASVKIVLKKLDGVSSAAVSFGEKRATVTYDPAKVTPQQMADTINAKLPYKAKVLTLTAEKP